MSSEKGRCLLNETHNHLGISIVDQAFSIWHHHPILVLIFGACFSAPPVRKGGIEMNKSTRGATSIPSMKVWSCIEDARGT
jgi:hypothetical protein